MQCLITVVFLILGIHVTLQSPDEWGYTDKHGPNTWEGYCQDGKRQSPIDIVDDDTLKADLGTLEFIKYDHLYKATLTNNGHTIQVTLKGQPVLSGGGLESNYQLEQMHFHWDAEHTINGYRDPLELHLVHYNKKYNNFTTAMKYDNGISVVAILFEKSEVDNKNLQPIIDAAKQVSNWELQNKYDIDIQGTILPTLFIPNDRTTYYRYEGSLTTPSCQEIVTWFVMTEKLLVSVSQLDVLRNIKNNEGPIVSNFRPTQKIYYRKVYHHLQGYSSSHTKVLSNSVYIILIVLSNILVFL